jgi:hypothetical protein
MTYETLIRIAPTADADRINDPARGDRRLYDRLTLLPRDIQLLANHDPRRVLGKVLRLTRIKEPDGYWIVASCELPGTPPEWMKRGTGASFAYIQTQMDSFGMNIVRDAFVTEVTVCDSTHQPLEPEARVLYVSPKGEIEAYVARERKRLGIGTNRAEELSRQTEARIAYREYVEAQAKAGILVRPAIGQVLGVR